MQAFTISTERGGRSGVLAYGGATGEDRPWVTLTLSRTLARGESVVVSRNGVPIDRWNSGAQFERRETRLRQGAYVYTAVLVDSAGGTNALDLNGPRTGSDFRIAVVD